MSMIKRYIENEATRLSDTYGVDWDVVFDIIVTEGSVKEAEEFCKEYVKRD